ncbi:PREDICTED: uncharacterized protein LOC106101501 [Papilio polytes]|uniref:uncharacterized protein LOC106101501 n=1 Tax=Papilio polytes TaxID=76194 RepID=UPI0006767DF6|nr:PREDICTED: uncharacterized protein LOC106101501 [Papilio polytes]
MRVEIPDCKRCCCFVPLRYGIIVLGYLNLIFALLVVSLETWLAVGDSSKLTMSMYRGLSFYTQMWLPVFLYTLEIVFNIILLIGAHLKKKSLLRIYYYYGITTTLASFFTLFVVKHRQIHHDFENTIIDLSFVFCGFALQIYLLLLIRTELKKLRSAQLSFINHVSEVMVDASHSGHGRNPL